jgi:acyl-ACP thioesterase
VQPVSPPFPVFAPAPARGRTFVTTRTVRSTDVSPGGRLRLDAVARYLQEAAEDDIAEAGWAPPYGWLLRRCAIVIRGYPSRGETVRLCTFCSGTGPRWAERTTTLTGPDGDVMQARAIWVAIGRATGEPVPLGPGFGRIYGESAQGHRVSARLSLPAPSGAGGGRDWPLRASDFDTAGHVNNTIHWAAVEEVLAGDGVRAGSRALASEGARAGNRAAAGEGARAGNGTAAGGAASGGAAPRARPEASQWVEPGWLPELAELEYHRPVLPGLLPRLLASREPGQVMVWLLNGGERLASARLARTPPGGPGQAGGQGQPASAPHNAS